MGDMRQIVGNKKPKKGNSKMHRMSFVLDPERETGPWCDEGSVICISKGGEQRIEEGSWTGRGVYDQPNIPQANCDKRPSQIVV